MFSIEVDTWDPVEGRATLWIQLRHVVTAKTAVWGDDDAGVDSPPEPAPQLWLKLSTGDTVFVFLTYDEWKRLILDSA